MNAKYFIKLAEASYNVEEAPKKHSRKTGVSTVGAATGSIVGAGLGDAITGFLLGKKYKGHSGYKLLRKLKRPSIQGALMLTPAVAGSIGGGLLGRKLGKKAEKSLAERYGE